MARLLYGIVLLFAISSCADPYVILEQPSVSNKDVSTSTADTAIVNLISPYTKVYNQTMNEIVGYAGEDLEKGYPEGKLGNLVADIFYHQARKDFQLTADNSFVLINNGGLRTSWAKGPITRSLVFELMPFENEFAVVEISGKYLLNGMADYILAKKGQPISSNLSITFKEGKLKEMVLNGKTIEAEKTYFIITSDYLSAGGDKMDFFKNGIIRETSLKGIKLRDSLLSFLQEFSREDRPLKSTNSGRIIIE